jgi:hypothetical protein
VNMQFVFAVECYREQKGKRVYKVGFASATGSVETRARRRLLEAIHHAGLFARRVEVVDCRKVK